MTPLVGVDPGHGGSNDGAFSPSGLTREADLTLAVGQAIHRLDPTVRLTRNDDQSIQYTARAKAFRSQGVVFVAALHFDSTPWAPYMHGCHLYYGKDDQVAFEAAKFAMMHTPPAISGGKILCAYDDPKTEEDNWKRDAEYICEVYDCPVLLFELGYLSNKRDLEYVISSHGIEDCAAFVLETLNFVRTNWDTLRQDA